MPEQLKMNERVKHKFSDYTGVITGIAEYSGLTERRIEVTAPKTADGKVVETWFVEGVLERAD